MLLEKIANELRNYLPNGKAVVDSYATKVASNYLHGGKNMTDQIRKLASTENLSDEYVKRVCEASNHKVSSHLYETSDDKNFQFDLAKWEDIISAPQEKTASVYDEKPIHYKTASVKLASEEFEKEALIGPIADAATLFLPSLIGNSIGRSTGNTAYEKGEEWEPSTAKALLMPGYLGYSAGKLKSINDNYRKDMLNGSKPIEEYVKSHRDELKDLTEEEFEDHIIQKGFKVPNLVPDLGTYNKFVKPGTKKVEKTAEEYYMKSDPMENLLDMNELLSRAEEDVRLKLAYVGNELNHVYKQLYNEFSDEVRFNGYFKVAQALVPYVDADLVEALTYDGLEKNLIKEDDLFHIEKVAEQINEECEFFKMAQYYKKLESEYSQYKLAHTEINQQLELVRNTLNKG